LRASIHRRRRQHQIRASQDAWAKYSVSHDLLKLNIGTGVHVLPGWFNVDFQPFYPGQYFMDATVQFPFPDLSFDFIRSEHMIEHIPYLDGMHMLRECYRVMRPGGVIRVATPDLKKLAKLYDEPLSVAQRAYVDAVFKQWRHDYQSAEVGVAINNIFEFGHRFVYDSGTLGEALCKAGFEGVVESRPGHSTHAPLLGTDAHAADDDYITFETLTLEAKRPKI
jgi:predicted SAM-dependent methyltransferase